MVELRALKEILVSQQRLGLAVLLVDSQGYAIWVKVGLTCPANRAVIGLATLKRRVMALVLQMRTEV